MNDELSYNISYDDMNKIVANYYAQQGRKVSLRISNEIDNDRFSGMVTSSMCLIEKTTLAGIESSTKTYFSIEDLKEIVNSVLEQEGKELLNLKNNATSSSKIEGYGMGEHEVKTIVDKSFTAMVKEKKISHLK